MNMKEDHADYVLAKMSVAFPGKPLTVEEVRYWVEKLVPYDFDQAMEALKRVEDNCKFWPSWAEYRAYLMACRKRPSYELPESTSVPLSPEELKEYNLKQIRAVRASVVARRDGREV